VGQCQSDTGETFVEIISWNGKETHIRVLYVATHSGVTRGLNQGSKRGPTSQHLENELRNEMLNRDVDVHAKTGNHRKTLRNMQKNNLLKTKRILNTEI